MQIHPATIGDYKSVYVYKYLIMISNNIPLMILNIINELQTMKLFLTIKSDYNMIIINLIIT